jgi:hypothetical protein
VKDFAKVSYAPVGRCIYCGSTEGLSREHIIPYALGSNAILPKASCERCRKITGDFEQDVLRGPMWPVRVINQLQSRTKHREAVETEHLLVVKEGQDQVVELPLEEYPILLPFLLFPPPAIISASEYTNGIQLTGQVTISFGANPENVLKRLGATQIRITPRKSYPVSFARMLAKIAYSYAFAEGALNALAGESVVLPSILGERDEIGLWVGMIDSSLIAREGVLHRLALIEDREHGFLMVEVQLFSNSQTPNYHVILGRLK